MLRNIGLFASAALLALCTSVAAEEIDNEEYKLWAKFKAGSWVTYKQVSDAGGTKSEMEMTHKVLENTGDKIVIETSTKMNMNGQVMDLGAQKRDIPAKVKKPEQTGDQPENKPKEGSEEIEVDGKKLKCKTWESTLDNAGTKTTSKTWMCDDIPGGLAKMESSSTGQMSSKMTMVAAKWEATN